MESAAPLPLQDEVRDCTYCRKPYTYTVAQQVAVAAGSMIPPVACDPCSLRNVRVYGRAATCARCRRPYLAPARNVAATGPGLCPDCVQCTS